MKASQVQALLDYMYRGEVSVSQDDFPTLLRVTKMPMIKGISEKNTKTQDTLPNNGDSASSSIVTLIPPPWPSCQTHQPQL